MNTVVIKINRDFTLFDDTSVRLYNITRYEGTARRNFPYHYHNYYEMSFLVRGQNHLIVNGKDYICEPGSICIVPPKVIHGNTVSNLSGVDRTWTFRVSLDENSPLVKKLDNRCCIFSVGEDAEFISALLERWLSVSENCLGVEEYVQAFSVLVLRLIFDKLDGNATLFRETSDPYYQDILLYIMKHYQKPFSLDELASQFAVSKSHLMRCFKQNFGISPIRYRNELQINEACSHLIHTQKTVQEIASELGFDSTSYFLRSFEKFIGFTPSEYREHFSELQKMLAPMEDYLFDEHVGFLSGSL